MVLVLEKVLFARWFWSWKGSFRKVILVLEKSFLQGGLVLEKVLSPGAGEVTHPSRSCCGVVESVHWILASS